MRRLALLALLAACGGDDGGGPIAIDDLEGAVINAYCNLYVHCGLIDDAATCRMLDLDLDADESLIEAVNAGKVIYHADLAGECLASISASCSVAQLDRNDDTAACEATFEGTVAAGGQCAMNEECVSQNCDVPSCPDACCQGTCVGDAPTPRPKVGEACGGTASYNCVDSYCDSIASVCKAYVADGQPCTSSSECDNGLCGADQLCTSLPGPGDACDLTTGESQCGEIGYTCSATSGTCVAVGLTGDACTTERDCSGIYTCGASGTCELGPQLGDACNVQGPPGDCIDRSFCEPTTMVCTAPKPAGAACQSSSECIDDCDFATSTCTKPPICI